MLTFLPLEQIDEMAKWEGEQLNRAKEILAWELTKMVHGEEEAEKAQTAARALFAGGDDDANMPTTELSEADLTDGKIDVLSLLTACGLIATRSEGRRLIQGGGLLIDGEKIADIGAAYTAEQLREGVRIRKGKKVHHKAVLI
jgi:tyrosyl-tRNA synthetase